MSETTGENLVRLGIVKPWQAKDIILAQQRGDTRSFGEIAIEFGYVDEVALKRYLDGE